VAPERARWDVFSLGMLVGAVLIFVTFTIRDRSAGAAWAKAPRETYLLDGDNTYRMYRVINRHGDTATAVPLVPMKVPVVLMLNPHTGESEWVIDARRFARQTPEARGGD